MSGPKRRVPGRSAAGAKRRGSVYVLVLGCATLLTAAGLSAIALSRIQVQKEVLAKDERRAADAAISGVHAALAFVNNTAGWRPTAAGWTSQPSITLDGATIRWAVRSAGGGAPGSTPEASVIVAMGQRGKARKVFRVLADPPASGPLDLLRCTLYSQGNITNAGGATSTGPISTPQTFTSTATLNADLEVGTLVSTKTRSGSLKTLVPPKTFPTVDASLSTGAVAISYASLPFGRFSLKTLTATYNPYGATSASGVYTISVPAGRTLEINTARIEATLIVTLGAGSSLVTSGQVLWQPAFRNKPTLIVSGSTSASISLAASSSSLLNEVLALANFNPSGAPFAGESDGKLDDYYPSEIQGAVLIDSAIPLTIENSQRIVGCVATRGTVRLDDAVLVADPALKLTTPLGFTGTDDTLSVRPGSWTWESYDTYASLFQP